MDANHIGQLSSASASALAAGFNLLIAVIQRGARKDEIMKLQIIKQQSAQLNDRFKQTVEALKKQE